MNFINNKKAKRIISLILALMMMSLCLFGCSKTKDSNSYNETETSKIAVDEEGNIVTKPGEEAPTVVTNEDGEVVTTVEGTTEGKSDTTAKRESKGLFQVSEDYAKNHRYCIGVNTKQNIVVVYEKDSEGDFTRPVKAFACSCGRTDGHDTPAGTYTTSVKQRWLYLIDGTYGQYCTKFKEHYWFHSVPYYSQDPSDLEWPEYNKLGNNASAGCVRMCVRDVKWLYDNVPLGTVVRVYSSSAAEPVAKPATIKIDTSSSNKKRGWDPTDPDSANPYNKPVSSKFFSDAQGVVEELDD